VFSEEKLVLAGKCMDAAIAAYNDE